MNLGQEIACVCVFRLNIDVSSVNGLQKQWGSDQEKEQLSPVSILDCPFEDDDEVSSPFQHRLARMEGDFLLPLNYLILSPV